MVYRWVQLQGDGKAEALVQPQRQATAPAKKMAPRHLAWLFLRDFEQLEKQEPFAWDVNDLTISPDFRLVWLPRSVCTIFVSGSICIWTGPL